MISNTASKAPSGTGLFHRDNTHKKIHISSINEDKNRPAARSSYSGGNVDKNLDHRPETLMETYLERVFHDLR